MTHAMFILRTSEPNAVTVDALFVTSNLIATNVGSLHFRENESWSLLSFLRPPSRWYSAVHPLPVSELCLLVPVYACFVFESNTRAHPGGTLLPNHLVDYR